MQFAHFSAVCTLFSAVCLSQTSVAEVLTHGTYLKFSFLPKGTLTQRDKVPFNRLFRLHLICRVRLDRMVLDWFLYSASLLSLSTPSSSSIRSKVDGAVLSRGPLYSLTSVNTFQMILWCHLQATGHTE